MKFNFKKIASVISSTVMVGSTVALAAAANFPAPFVANGAGDVAIVYGSGAAQTDLVAVADIQNALSDELAKQTATSGSSTSSATVTGGDFVKLERTNDKFNLGDKMSDFYSTLDNEELSTVLASGTYENDANDEYDFDQEIALGSSDLQFFKDSEFNDNKPVIGFDMPSGTHVMNYTLDFTPDAAQGGTDYADFEGSELTLLGRTYYIAKAQNVSSKPKLTLLDTANSAIVTEGAGATSISAGGTSYSVTIDFIDSDEVILNVNGKQTNKLKEGDVFSIGNNTYVAVKNILYNSKDTGISKADISIGSGKIVLEDAKEVQINNNDVSENSDSILNSYISTDASGYLDKIVLEWNLDEDSWLAGNTTNTSLVFPGFETIKISMAGFNEPQKEITEVANDGDEKVRVKTSIKDGTVDLDILYSNSSTTGFTGLGESATHVLLTNGTTSPSFTLNETLDNYFVATWISGDDAESYAYEIQSITDADGKNETKLKNLATGGSDVVLTEVGDVKDVGQLRLTLVSANDALKTATILASRAGGAGTVYGDRLVSKAGLQMRLPVDSAADADGNINLTALGNIPSWGMNFTEEDDNDNVAQGESFNITVGYNGDQTSVTSVGKTTYSNGNNYETEEDSNDYVGYVNSSLATKVLYKTGGDQDTVEIEYHGGESYADVFVSESGAAVVPSSGTTTSGTVRSLGSVIYKDTEASSVSGKNLIVVGGSCVNSVAASLLGVAPQTCGAAFTAKTQVASNQYLIQTFSQTGGKVATLVAGFNAGDTTNAAKYLRTQSVDTTVGKKYVGSTDTVAVASTVTA